LRSPPATVTSTVRPRKDRSKRETRLTR
jgi:hypothetical protein